MGWERVVGQHRAVAALKRSIVQDRVGHAYLFFGPPGVGKLATALAFGQALLCERGGQEPCGSCGACHKVLRGLHADLRIHLPYPKGKDYERPPDLPRRIVMAAEDPYVRVDYRARPRLDDAGDTVNKLARYPIDYVRDELVRAQSFRPVEGRYRVAIVTDADLLQEQGSNALLKGLEEPPTHAVNILITDRHDLLLPTIRSRCDQVRFVKLEAADLEKALINRGVDIAKAESYARMADGSLARAIELSGDVDLVERHERAIRFLVLSGSGEIEQLGKLVEEIAGSGRERSKATLLALLDFVRDLIVYSETGDVERIVNVDKVEAMDALCRRCLTADFAAIVGLVEQGVMLSERNVHARLLIATLAQRIGRALRGREVGPLYLPLAAPVVAG